MLKKGILLLSMLLTFPNIAFAGGIENSKLGTGLKKLLTDVTGWLPLIALSAGGACIGYFFIRRQAADEMDKKMWTKRIETAITSTIGAIIGASMLSVIIAYFK